MSTIKVKSHKRAGKAVKAHTRVSNKDKKRSWATKEGEDFRRKYGTAPTPLKNKFRDASNVQLGRYVNQPIKFSQGGTLTDEETGEKFRVTSRAQRTKLSPNTKKNYLKKHKKVSKV